MIHPTGLRHRTRHTEPHRAVALKITRIDLTSMVLCDGEILAGPAKQAQPWVLGGTARGSGLHLPPLPYRYVITICGHSLRPSLPQICASPEASWSELTWLRRR